MREERFIDIITLDDLTKAIVNRIGISIDEAKKDAGFILDIFGFNDRVIDNILDPCYRQLFYILEEECMLTTDREETTLRDGREWRTHYWILRKDIIIKYSRDKNVIKKSFIKRKKMISVSDKDIYTKLDEKLWISRRIPSI